MTDLYLLIWYMVITIGITMASYYALMAIDFSKIFKANSTWQIRMLSLIISIGIGFVVANGFVSFLERILRLL